MAFEIKFSSREHEILFHNIMMIITSKLDSYFLQHPSYVDTNGVFTINNYGKCFIEKILYGIAECISIHNNVNIKDYRVFYRPQVKRPNPSKFGIDEITSSITENSDVILNIESNTPDYCDFSIDIFHNNSDYCLYQYSRIDEKYMNDMDSCNELPFETLLNCRSNKNTFVCYDFYTCFTIERVNDLLLTDLKHNKIVYNMNGELLSTNLHISTILLEKKSKKNVNENKLPLTLSNVIDDFDNFIQFCNIESFSIFQCDHDINNINSSTILTQHDNHIFKKRILNYPSLQDVSKIKYEKLDIKIAKFSDISIEYNFNECMNKLFPEYIYYISSYIEDNVTIYDIAFANEHECYNFIVYDNDKSRQKKVLLDNLNRNKKAIHKTYNYDPFINKLFTELQHEKKSIKRYNTLIQNKIFDRLNTNNYDIYFPGEEVSIMFYRIFNFMFNKNLSNLYITK